MTTTMDIRQPLQVMTTAILTLVLWVLGIVWHIVKEIINGVYRMAIGFIVLLVSVGGFIGLILWLLTLKTSTTMAKRRNKSVSQQCKFYEVDNIFEYMVETYINGNFSSFKELYHEVNKDARKDFTDFLLSEVEPIYWREILKATILP